MARILILGAGAISTAFSVPCLDRQHKVVIVGTHLENIFIDKLKKNNYFHPSLKLNISKKTNIKKYNHLSIELKKRPDLIVLGVSTKGINWSIEQLKNSFFDKKLPPILMLTKGLSVFENKYEFLVNKFKRLLMHEKFQNINISAVGGPCLANGLASKVHTSVIFANKNLKTVKWLKDILTTNYYHPSISSDINGIQTCAAIKNIFSMAIGAYKGLSNETINKKLKNHNHLNAAASLVKQSLYEMEVFVDFLKGNKNTVYGLAGIGDLYVSATGGRNSKMGSYIGAGYTYSKAKRIKMPNETIEGAELVEEIGLKIKKDFNIAKMPIMLGMINAILDNKKLVIDWSNFQ